MTMLAMAPDRSAPMRGTAESREAYAERLTRQAYSCLAEAQFAADAHQPVGAWLDKTRAYLQDAIDNFQHTA